MIRADLVVTGIRELATLDTGPVPRTGEAMRDLGLTHDVVLGVDGGRFAYLGTRGRARRELRVRRRGATIDLEGSVVVPGFVDPHTHLVFAGDRHHELERKVRGASYLDLAKEGGGLFSTVRATRRATTASLVRSATHRLRRMVESGTTTVEAKSGYALDHAGELRLLEVLRAVGRAGPTRLVPTYLGAHAIPPEFVGNADGYVDQIVRRTLPAVARRGLAKFCDVFCEPGFFTVDQSERILRAALAVGLGVKIHADEFVYSGGAALAARLIARSAEHLLETPAADRAALARAGVTAVLLPVTPFASLAATHSPGREMVDAGVPVAIGTDLSPNSYVVSMSVALSHAVHSARLTPAEALTAATVNAAHATGVDDSAGTISVGRPADFSAFELGAVEEIPYRIGSHPTAVYRQGIRISPR